MLQVWDLLKPPVPVSAFGSPVCSQLTTCISLNTCHFTCRSPTLHLPLSLDSKKSRNKQLKTDSTSLCSVFGFQKIHDTYGQFTVTNWPPVGGSWREPMQTWEKFQTERPQSPHHHAAHVPSWWFSKGKPYWRVLNMPKIATWACKIKRQIEEEDWGFW